jgi:Sec-independent protein secretion pathway component TatC
MAKYEWHSSELQRKAKNYDWASVIIIAVAALLVMAFKLVMFGAILMIPIIVLQIIAVNIKNNDKRLINKR